MVNSRFMGVLCRKSFAHKYNLNIHILTHPGPKYLCQTCGKLVYRTDSVAEHQDKKCQQPLATDGKICDLCGHTFTRKSNLTCHKKECTIKQNSL